MDIDVTNKHIYIFVEEKEYFCGPITKCYACAMCFLFFPVVFFLPCFPCDERKKTRLRNKNSLDEL